MEHEIKHIEWDSSGTKLLLADAGGQISLWQMQESLVNKWMYTHFSRSVFGDDLIALRLLSSASPVRPRTCMSIISQSFCHISDLMRIGTKSLNLFSAHAGVAQHTFSEVARSIRICAFFIVTLRPIRLRSDTRNGRPTPLHNMTINTRACQLSFEIMIENSYRFQICLELKKHLGRSDPSDLMLEQIKAFV